ncbi:MAG: ROK family protein, partial [Actinobacteria bacterium]|nr:ROK family protein [Actinomycetota bacterium]
MQDVDVQNIFKRDYGLTLTDDEAKRFSGVSYTNYDATVRELVQLVTQLETTQLRRATVGMGIPGVVVPGTGLVKNANSTWLIGKPLKTDLERALAREVRIENDANCFALSEASDGA